jgi:hypothetical protein
MILWFSTTIHSAQLQDSHYKYDYTDVNQKWLGWRGVFYICYRNKNEIDKSHADRLLSSFNDNRTTNHWGVKVFPKYPKYSTSQSFTKEIENYLYNPELVYEKFPEWKPDLTPEIKKFLGDQ